MHFMIVGDEGFAISDNLKNFYELIEKNVLTDIYIELFPFAEQAYVKACQTYVARYYRQYNFYPPLPQFDDLMQVAGFYLNPLPPKLKKIASYAQYFGVITEQGYLCSADFADIIEFVKAYCNWQCEIFESPDCGNLLGEIPQKYIFQRMAMSAYVSAPLMIPPTAHLGMAFLDYNLQKTGITAYRRLLIECQSQSYQ
ncbi:hypothetical protein [Pectinatus haikarae]|uniref:Uncharacterized protein n=1 Tax=Pectinatus haikarae TaxID=349096 RepID=A0ABT9Y526_9FIRM|nr:hypothetical protein [Pectinatus haikarae]MDQ0202839.1 hypothetical protein [Pectinatus haikarae]